MKCYYFGEDSSYGDTPEEVADFYRRFCREIGRMMRHHPEADAIAVMRPKSTPSKARYGSTLLKAHLDRR